MSLEDRGLTQQPTFDPGFTTPEMTEIWSPSVTVRSMLEFEAGLALALADAGVIDSAVGAQLAAACAAPPDDPYALLASAWESGTPLIAMIDIVKSRIDDEDVRRWLHHGATSQDAIDTGRMLQSRASLALLEGQVLMAATNAAGLVDRYRDQPQMGRTFLQDSRPTTFGWRAAGWLSPLLDGIDDLAGRRAALPVQLGGPDARMGSYGEAGPRVRSALAVRLGLADPALSWHTDRSPLWRVSRSVESLALTLSKIAVDVALLAQSSIGEVRPRPGGSSSMPGKRNPIDAIHTVAAASACSGFASMVVGGRHELDRGIGGWHVEWLGIPMLFQTASAAVSSLGRCLESLEVDSDAMTNHVDGVPADIPDPAPLEGVLARFRRLSDQR